MSELVKTKNATYVIDREARQWLRTSLSHPRPDDGEWIAGGFTLGEVGGRGFAHFANHPDGATGRWTSTITSIESDPTS